jgi:predicted aspartyl protease
MKRFRYNAQLQPPAPFVLVTLANPLTGAEVNNVPAQIDTAADRTLLPSTVVEHLALPVVGDIPIGGVGGTVSLMTVYAVLLTSPTQTALALEVVAHPNEAWVLLGRDVLNSHRVVLDGPGLALEVS